MTEAAHSGHCAGVSFDRFSLTSAFPYFSRLPIFALCLAAVLAVGCARVAPYERGTLARKDMELGENPDAAAGEEHAIAYREGSSGGGAAKGGGCGCN